MFSAEKMAERYDGYMKAVEMAEREWNRHILWATSDDAVKTYKEDVAEIKTYLGTPDAYKTVASRLRNPGEANIRALRRFGETATLVFLYLFNQSGPRTAVVVCPAEPWKIEMIRRQIRNMIQTFTEERGSMSEESSRLCFGKEGNWKIVEFYELSRFQRGPAIVFDLLIWEFPPPPEVPLNETRFQMEFNKKMLAIDALYQFVLPVFRKGNHEFYATNFHHESGSLYFDTELPVVIKRFTAPPPAGAKEA